MTDFLIFNHDSLPFEDDSEINNYILIFLKICINASVSAGMKTILMDETLDNKWFRIELFNGYYWQDWYDQNKNNNQLKEVIRSFRSIVTKSLFNQDNIKESVSLYEVSVKETMIQSTALKAATWYEVPVLSYPTNSIWDKDFIDILVEYMDETEKIITEEKSISNIYNLESWEKIKISIVEERNKNISNGKELWLKRKELYPKLNFCGRTSSQLQVWNFNKTIFDQVKNALLILNENADELITNYSHEILRELGLANKVSGESTTVLHNPRLKGERLFYLPNGEIAFFENHVKLPQGIRMHFYIDSNEKIIHIGYIGNHLHLN